MIVKMKEIWLFALSSSVDETVQQLGELGIVDVKEIKPINEDQIAWNTEKLQQSEKAISILNSSPEIKITDKTRKKYNSKNPEKLIDRILYTEELKKKCHTALEDYKKQLEWYKVWGENTDPKSIKYLNKKGIYISLYHLDKRLLGTLPEDLHIVTFPEKERKIPIALFSRTEGQKLKFKEQPLPALSLTQIKKQIARKERQLKKVDYFLSDHIKNISLIKEYQNYLKDRLHTKEVLEGMGTIEGRISYLRGYIPYNKEDLLKEKAKQKNWGYKIMDPENPDEVPVYIKNPKWVSIIKPVMQFIDIVPGYKEVDVSIYFLIAFSLFFAMLVGDAGYGLVFLLIAFLLRKKLSAQMLFLIYVLSGSTIIWGVLSGTYFGSETIAGIPFFRELIITEISSFGVDNISFMMHLSFLIGAIHLTVAHCIRAFQFINSIRALSEIGWIAITWGLFFVVETLVLGKAMPDWYLILFIAGPLMVAFFSMEGKNFLSSVLASIGNLPLSLINGFSDIVSYVRLFAVGMATAMVAASFNNMIIPKGVDLNFLEMIMAAIALLLGHGMNIVLALMAVMVHGIRLNMLEFAGHLGVQFTGEAYQPFRLNKAHTNAEE